MDPRAPATVESVFRAEAPRMWRALVLHTGDPDRASDVVAEAFAQALGRGDEVRDPSAWVWKTAFLLAGRSGHSDDEPLEGHDRLAPPTDVDGLLDVLRALEKLTPHQRGAVILHYFVGYSTREVAGILGSTKSAVGVHLFRARQRLRQDLGDDDD